MLSPSSWGKAGMAWMQLESKLIQSKERWDKPWFIRTLKEQSNPCIRNQETKTALWRLWIWKNENKRVNLIRATADRNLPSTCKTTQYHNPGDSTRNNHMNTWELVRSSQFYSSIKCFLVTWNNSLTEYKESMTRKKWTRHLRAVPCKYLSVVLILINTAVLWFFTMLKLSVKFLLLVYNFLSLNSLWRETSEGLQIKITNYWGSHSSGTWCCQSYRKFWLVEISHAALQCCSKITH